MTEKGRAMKPESLMMSLGYKPELSEGAIKCPIFQTSTFVFKTAEEGKAFFELAYGQREPNEGEDPGLIYSRLNNPDLQILEERLALWDGADEAAVFESGMAAIATVMMEFLSPGDVLVHSAPLYGGTHSLIAGVLSRFGVKAISFLPGEQEDEIAARIEAEREGRPIGLIYAETPANPTNDLIDLEMCARLAARFSTEERRVPTAIDNTYLGPMWQTPLRHGIDLVIYSATKFLGGHSDLIAGSVSGRRELVKRIKTLRTFFGNMAGPWTGWMLMRSLETLKVRTDRQCATAQVLADWLAQRPEISAVFYLGHLKPGTAEHDTYLRQCTAPGAMIAFEVVGGEAAAFKFLNALRLVHLAVSLGSTESLAESPAAMTHCDLPAELKQRLGITPGLVRLSVGVEDADDLISDLSTALDASQR
jgi:methionine-gamma-lyase